MARLQLALTVADVDRSAAFYERLLGVAPAKTKPGYVNFEVADPPLKLVLMQGEGERLNHLGIEVPEREEVEAAGERLRARGLLPVAESGVCCYAEQEKVWVTDPDGAAWEVYTVLGDAEEAPANAGSCC